jgi:hypothetical protein
MFSVELRSSQNDDLAKLELLNMTNDMASSNSAAARVDPYAADPGGAAGEPVPMPADGPRVLGFGAHAHVAAAVQDRLRTMGMRATAIAIADDAESDAQLIEALAADAYDAIAIGGFLSGQDPQSPATAESTVWFNRVLNIVHRDAPGSRIVLVRGPANAAADIGRVLAE